MQPFTIKLSGPITDVRPPVDLFTAMNLPEIKSRFWNTTNEAGQTLKTYRAKAAEQDARILAIMQDIGVASPSQVWKAMDKLPPITSVRRSLNTLTRQGKTEKTDRKMISPWDRPEHFWKIVTP